MEQEFRDVWDQLDISFDDFIRTTEPRHQAAVQELVRRIRAAGDVYEGIYEGWYCVGCEAFKQEKDLVDGKCPLHGDRRVDHARRTTSSGCRSTGTSCSQHFAAHPEFLEPDVRRNEILRLLEAGLEDISISRAGQSLGHSGARRSGQRRLCLVRRADQLRVRGRVWHRSRTLRALVAGRPPRHRQRHHALPHGDLAGDADERRSSGAAAGLRPRVHERGRPADEQVARQRRRSVRGGEPDGVDPLRLFLVKEVTYGGDGDFSWARLQERYNVDLANNLGNLVSRIAAMAEKYRGGTVKRHRRVGAIWRPLQRAAVADYRQHMDVFALEKGAAAAFRIVDAANEYIAETAALGARARRAASGRV